MLRQRVAAIGLMLVLMAVACDEAPTNLPELEVATVDVGPADATLLVGDTVRLTAYPKAADGTVLGSVAITWTTPAPEKVELTADGIWVVARAKAPGVVEVRATSEGKIGRATLTVAQPPASVDSVAVSPWQVALEVGDTATLTATLYGEDGAVLEDRVVAWTAVDTLVATVDASGLVTARAPGTTAVRALSEGVQGEATVVVPEPPVPVGFVQVEPGLLRIWVGQRTWLLARTFSANGLPLEGRTVTWSAQDTAVATVGDDAELLARSAGTTDVFAHSEGVTGAATVKSYVFPAGSAELLFKGMRSDTSSSVVQPGIDTVWVDENGVEHPATMWASGGSMSLEWEGPETSYQHELVLQTWIVDGLYGRMVEEATLVDRGTLYVFYDMFTGGPIFEFRSTEAEELLYWGRFSLPGELRVVRPVGAVDAVPFFFELQP